MYGQHLDYLCAIPTISGEYIANEYHDANRKSRCYVFLHTIIVGMLVEYTE